MRVEEAADQHVGFLGAAMVRPPVKALQVRVGWHDCHVGGSKLPRKPAGACLSMNLQCKQPRMAEETFSKQAARAAYGWGRPKSWDEALALLGEAEANGEPNAARQVELVSQAPIEQLLNCPPVEPLSTVSQIGVVRGFAPCGFSEWLIG